VNVRTETLVTYDNNRIDNRWSYHPPQFTPHVTELFCVKPLGNSQVEIVGFPPSSGVTWHLTVREVGGVPRRFPRFRPITNGGNATVHDKFVQTDSDGLSSFSFTASNGATYYLVPTGDDTLFHIETMQDEVLDDMQKFSFITGISFFNFRNRRRGRGSVWRLQLMSGTSPSLVIQTRKMRQ
jgi:hypothetical protein